MNDPNERLEAALKQDAATFDDTEASMRELLVTTFRGKMRIWSFFVYFWLATFAAGAVAAGGCFFQADAVKDLILYAGLFGVSLLMIVVLKLWYWMLMNRNAVLREVKRLELRVAELAERLDDDGHPE